MSTVMVKLLIGGLAAVAPHGDYDMTVLLPKAEVEDLKDSDNELPEHKAYLVFLAEDVEDDCSSVGAAESKLPASDDRTVCFLEMNDRHLTIESLTTMQTLGEDYLVAIDQEPASSHLSDASAKLNGRARIRLRSARACDAIGDARVAGTHWSQSWFSTKYGELVADKTLGVLASGLMVEADLSMTRGKTTIPISNLAGDQTDHEITFTPRGDLELLWTNIPGPTDAKNRFRDVHFLAHHEIAQRVLPLERRPIPSFPIPRWQNPVPTCESPFSYDCGRFKILVSEREPLWGENPLLASAIVNEDHWSRIDCDPEKCVEELCKAGPPICPKAIFAESPAP